MGRDISPPPVKRRKLATLSAEPRPPAAPSQPTETFTTLSNYMKTPRSFRLFSWNINGVAPYLPSQTTTITSFFKPSDASQQPPRPKPNSLRTFLSRHNFPEALFLQELKIQNGNTKALATLLTSLNAPLNENDTLSDSRTYTLDTVLPRDKFNAKGFQGKLYGVGTILRADFAREHVARVREAAWDLEGRVSVVELHHASESSPNRHKPLALVNVYAVNGTSAPYRSPATGLVVGTRHDHKLAFHSRLRDECLALEGSGFCVVVAGDVNVARGLWDGYPNLRTWPRQHCVNRADFNRKFFGEADCGRANAYVGISGSTGDRGRDADGNDEGEGGDWKERKNGTEEDGGGQGNREQEEKRRRERKREKEKCLDAVDVFRAMHGDERRYTYYPRTREWGSSCDRVDMVFVSRGLWESGRVRRTGILDTPQERGLSDHVPLWVEVEL
ncbi:hypothetical protein VTI74DRAFT_1643 [Chaetomium olivicolor]